MKINFDSLEPVCERKNFAVQYDRANNLAYMRCEGVPIIEPAKEVLEAVILYAHKNRITCAVVDLTKATGTFTGINGYMKDRFIPTMLPLGYKYVGMVTSDNPFTKFAINSMISLFTPKGLKVKMFPSIKACEEWISELEEYKENA